MEEKIYSILEDVRPEFDFRESDDFIEDGYLDSFDIVTLVAEIEGCFGIEIDPFDMRLENFSTISALVNLIKKSGGDL